MKRASHLGGPSVPSPGDPSSPARGPWAEQHLVGAGPPRAGCRTGRCCPQAGWAAQAGKIYPRAAKRFPSYLQWPDTGAGIINLNSKGFIVLLVLLSLINVMSNINELHHLAWLSWQIIAVPAISCAFKHHGAGGSCSERSCRTARSALPALARCTPGAAARRGLTGQGA